MTNMKSISKIFKSKVLGRTAIASVDQALTSLTNLGVTLLLLKLVPKIDFGYFNIVLTVTTYITWIQNAVVTTPLNVLLASKNAAEEKIFSSALFKGQIVTITFFSIITVTVSLLVYFVFYNSFVLLVIAAASFSLIGILSRSYFRQLSYAQEKPQRALKQDLLFTIFYFVFIGLTLLISRFNIVTVIIGMGVCNILVFTIYNIKESTKVHFSDLKSAYTETWKFGRWSLIGITVTHLQTYSYQYLIAIMLGSLAVADNSASRLLMSPLVFMQAGWGSIIRPRGAKLREQNLLNKFFKELILASITITVLISSYMIVLYSAGDLLQKFLFTDKYKDSMEYVFYWGGIFIFQYIRANASFGLQVIKKFKNIALINAFSMIITIATSYLLILQYQIKGALIASIIGEIILGGLLWYFLHSYIKGKDPFQRKFFNSKKNVFNFLFNKSEK